LLAFEFQTLLVLADVTDATDGEKMPFAAAPRFPPGTALRIHITLPAFFSIDGLVSDAQLPSNGPSAQSILEDQLGHFALYAVGQRPSRPYVALDPTLLAKPPYRAIAYAEPTSDFPRAEVRAL
jgi:hypothetical protein